MFTKIYSNINILLFGVHSNMEVFFVFTYVIILFFVVIYFATKYNINQSKKILNSYGVDRLQKIEISFSQDSYTNFSFRGGFVFKVNLYFDDGLLIFTPKENSIFSALKCSLPIILTRNTNLPFCREYQCKVVDNIFFNSNSIKLTYTSRFLEKTYHEIFVYSDDDFEKLKEIILNFKESSV